MLFTTVTFALFFAVFFLLYWYVFGANLRLQNLFILIGSYVFYAWWDWRFLFLLVGSSLLNYLLGIAIAKNSNEKRSNFLSGVGITLNLACLIFFKYCNFFIQSLVGSLAWLHIRADIPTLNIILPLGISFYTFKGISYLLDVRNGKTEATTNGVVFFSYMAFFPALIAGPIDRPKTLIPQLQNGRVFNYSQASDGMRQILWGLFKKIVIADNCAAISGPIFAHYQTQPASALLFAIFLFTIQVYADFSGYSDMAIGLAGLLGFKITGNFNYPFFAQNIPDFWRRWHISLTNWFTDYVFMPLNISLRDYGKLGLTLTILINFTLIGIWHGANWTFVVFGFVHGCLFIGSMLKRRVSKKKDTPQLLNIAGTFILLMLTFAIFRADNLSQAFGYYQRLFSTSIFSGFSITEKVNTVAMLTAIVLMFWVEWLQRDKQHGLQIDTIKKFPVRALIYFGLIGYILTFSPVKITDFIYFKF